MKKRLIPILATALCCLSLTACSVTETEEYKQLQASYDTLQANYNDLEARNNDANASKDLLSDEIAKLKDDYKELEDEYDSLESKYSLLETLNSTFTLSTSIAECTVYDMPTRVNDALTGSYLDAGDYTLECIKHNNSFAMVSIWLTDDATVKVCEEFITKGSRVTFNVQTPGVYSIHLVATALTDTEPTLSDESQTAILVTKQNTNGGLIKLDPIS